MDRLESMAILLAVAEAGSLSAGARLLGIPLATVSRKVAELERHLAISLLHRTSRRIAMTEAGQSYVIAARRILDDVAEAERAASGEYAAPKGDLALTAPVVFGRLHVLPVVTDFLRAFAQVDIRMALADRIVDLDEEHVDLAVRIGNLPDSSMVATRVGMLRWIVCASRDYLDRHGVPGRPSDLQGHDCITFAGLGQASGWTFGDHRSPQMLRVRARLVVNDAEAAVAAAAAGLGITRVISYQAEAAIADGTLVVILPAFEPPGLPVHLVHRGSTLMPRKLRAFIDHAVPALRTRLAGLRS